MSGARSPPASLSSNGASRRPARAALHASRRGRSFAQQAGSVPERVTPGAGRSGPVMIPVRVNPPALFAGNLTRLRIMGGVGRMLAASCAACPGSRLVPPAAAISAAITRGPLSAAATRGPLSAAAIRGGHPRAAIRGGYPRGYPRRPPAGAIRGGYPRRLPAAAIRGGYAPWLVPGWAGSRLCGQPPETRRRWSRVRKPNRPASRAERWTARRASRGAINQCDRNVARRGPAQTNDRGGFSVNMTKIPPRSWQTVVQVMELNPFPVYAPFAVGRADAGIG